MHQAPEAERPKVYYGRGVDETSWIRCWHPRLRSRRASVLTHSIDTHMVVARRPFAAGANTAGEDPG